MTELNGVRIPAGYTGIGMHDTPGAQAAAWDYNTTLGHVAELKARGITCYKLFDSGANKVQRARAYVDNGILVVVRPWIDKPWGRGLPVTPGDQIKPYVDAGVQLIELGNEWNISAEWNGPVPNAQGIATEVVNWWERCLSRASEVPGMVPLFPSNTPGGDVDHRLCFQAIRAELIRRGLLDTVRHVAIHPRPLNNPPWAEWTASNTCTFSEWTWILANFQPDAYYWATEHGYAINDSQNAEYPRIDLDLWLTYNWQLQQRMNPANGDAIGPRLAGTFHWIEALWGHRVCWLADSLRDANVPEMPTPSPLWVKMGEQPHRFERYSGDVPEPEPEIVDGVDISYAQSAGLNWEAAWSNNVRFAYVRAGIGLCMDTALLGHVDQARYHTPDVKIGLYWYLSNSYDGKRQARLFAALNLLLMPELQGAVDVEASGLTQAKVAEFVEAYKTEMGEYPLIYTRASYVMDWGDLPSKCKLWVADAHNEDAPALPAGWADWLIWQWGCKTGPEYATPIDRNRMKSGAEPEPPEPPDDEIFTVEYLDGGPYVVGDCPTLNAEVCVGDACTIAGTKPEWGEGGFLVTVPPGTWTLTVYGVVAGEVVTIAGKTARVVWL